MQRTAELAGMIAAHAVWCVSEGETLPYRHASGEGGFAVHRPKFLSYAGTPEPPFGAIGEAFFRGVEGHERGAEVWEAHLDESH
jgi:hypothetical protein